MTAEELTRLMRETDPEPMRLRAENRELRRMLGVLVTWIAEREDLLGFLHAEIARREERMVAEFRRELVLIKIPEPEEGTP